MNTLFDIVIYGATGFTGRIAAQEMMSNSDFANFKIAIAGRNHEKLIELQNACKNKPEIIIADSANPESIDRMVQQTKLVLSFAGPFSLYGEPVIAACAKYGRDYLDITGETPFIRQMIDKYQEAAIASGARLIPFAGFDSVPADLCTYLGLEESRQHSFQIDSMTSYYSLKGGFNGGTLATAMYMRENKQSSKIANPNLLIPDPNWPTPKRAQLKPRYEELLQRWSIPFFMAPINTAVIRRSAWLQKNNRQFDYEERLLLGKEDGYFRAMLSFATLSLFGILSKYHLGRKLLKAMGPKPGEGPSDQKRKAGYFKGQLICRDKGKVKASISIAYPGDPGNTVTIALANSCTLLAAKNVYASDLKGFITPTVAFGDKLYAQLKQSGFQFTNQLF